MTKMRFIKVPAMTAATARACSAGDDSEDDMVNNAAAGRALARGVPAERSERVDGRLRRRAVFDERAPVGGRGDDDNASGSETDGEDGAYADRTSTGQRPG